MSELTRELVRCEFTPHNAMGREPSLRGACRQPARRYVQPVDAPLTLARAYFCSAAHASAYVEALEGRGYETETGRFQQA